jgi:hypothetical protein
MIAKGQIDVGQRSAAEVYGLGSPGAIAQATVNAAAAAEAATIDEDTGRPLVDYLEPNDWEDFVTQPDQSPGLLNATPAAATVRPSPAAIGAGALLLWLFL